MPACRVDDPDQLEAALRRSLGGRRPSLVEARVSLADLGAGSENPSAAGDGGRHG